ncbi:MAG: enolase C-terminal domain-like protein, partial [Ginsengibacter sp.]
ELRKHTDAIFRIDANAAWTAEEALEKIIIFKDLGVQFIEQPLAKDDWEGMRFLKDRSPIPLIADESCVSEHDVNKCAEYFNGINIKLTKCSGITPALRMIENARSHNLKIMLGCMNESSVGTAALAQLAPKVDYADMDGPLILAEDVAGGVKFEYGKIIYNNLPGLGLTIEPFQ